MFYFWGFHHKFQRNKKNIKKYYKYLDNNDYDFIIKNFNLLFKTNSYLSENFDILSYIHLYQNCYFNSKNKKYLPCSSSFISLYSKNLYKKNVIFDNGHPFIDDIYLINLIKITLIFFNKNINNNKNTINNKNNIRKLKLFYMIYLIKITDLIPKSKVLMQIKNNFLLLYYIKIVVEPIFKNNKDLKELNNNLLLDNILDKDIFC